jgi:acetoin utilization deacetylase AcuC-like enzyme
MILYDDSASENLFDYGILIPIDTDRVPRILNAIEKKGIAAKTFSQAASLLRLDENTLITREDLERVHAPEYIARFYGADLERLILEAYELVADDGTYNRYAPERAIRPLASHADSIARFVLGTYLALRVAIERKGEPYRDFCFCLGGGCHHPRYDAPSGFGVLNDPVIAVRKIIAEGKASFVWIIDVDAHKGDGTAELVCRSRALGETFVGKNPRVLTLSAHMARGWPLDEESLAKAVPGHAPLVESDIDIPIESGEENDYVPRLERALKKLEELSGERKSEPKLPDLALVIAGADVYEKDGLASTSPIALSLEQIVERDKLIFSFLRERGIPSGWVMAGGYGSAAWEPTAAFLNAVL